MTTTAATHAQTEPADATDVKAGLQASLATALDLHSQLKQAHWTIVGSSFIALHELFDRQASTVLDFTDKFAERIRALGGVPAGTVRQAAAASTLADLGPAQIPEAEAVRAMLDRFEAFATALRASAGAAAEAGDVATEDLYIEALREADQQAWFLRAHTG